MYSITDQGIAAFRAYLEEREYSRATVQKYMHDVRVLREYAGGRLRDRAQLNGFRDYLEEKRYAARSINSMLGAVNCFLGFLGCPWTLRYMKTQRQNFRAGSRELDREEYERMTRAASEHRMRKAALLLQTLCSLGIRVSELSAVTAESLDSGEAVIRNKGKLRIILIPEGLAKTLRAYCREKGVERGPVFVTRTGRPLDRSNIWKLCKKLAAMAGVSGKKAFPHNLRHLFARVYYNTFKDVVRLADILGHSSIDTTRIYTAQSGREERRQLDRLNLVFR